MREIKFRGFDTENSCWRYGWFTRLQEGCRKYSAIICDEDGTLTRYYIHDEDTVGQFTGLHDKNGVQACVGDILNTWIDGYLQSYQIVIETVEQLYIEMNHDDHYYTLTDFEIIGNRFDNPELRS